MGKVKAQADDITMSGGGLYSLATIGAKDVIDAATPLVTKAIKETNLDDNLNAFVLSDMGCADGGTSLNMVRSAIKTINTQQSSLPVQVVYADQPRNDFNALVKIINGLTDFKTYLDEFDNVFPTFAGTSFYKQILPPNTLHIGFSATAMHWLSAKPTNISNHVHAVGAQGKELAAFQNHARNDWAAILRHRANELRSGGHLVLVNFCRDQQGRYLGNTDGINMFDTFNQIWQQHVDNKVITQEEYVNMTLPQYYNNVEEFSAPFNDTNSEVSKAGLRLAHIETRVVDCPFKVDFQRHGDAKKFAHDYIPTIRTWNESIYFGALSAQRPMQERKEIIENYYNTYESMVANNPKGHAMDYVHAYMVIKKD